MIVLPVGRASGVQRDPQKNLTVQLDFFAAQKSRMYSARVVQQVPSPMKMDSATDNKTLSVKTVVLAIIVPKGLKIKLAISF